MKKLFHLLFVITLLLTQACKGPEGEQGPPGPAGPAGTPGATGPQGPAGTSSTAKVFELGYTFNAENGYSFDFTFAEIGTAIQKTITLGENDAVLLYWYLGQEDDQSDVWMPLPNSLPVPNTQGTLGYNFVHTRTRLTIFMQTTIPTANLGSATDFTNQQGFRVVIVPGAPINGRIVRPNINYNNYNEVAKYYNIQEKDIQRVKM